MVERLEVSKSWLSRYLELARMPQEVVAAFGSPHAIGISHGAALAPLLRVSAKRERLIAEAGALAAQQAQLAAQGAAFLKPAVVVQRLVRAAEAKEVRRAKPLEHVVRADDGAILARGQRGARGGSVSITIPSAAARDRVLILSAVADLLDEIVGKA
jgi:ParB family chromosome partitioning protein